MKVIATKMGYFGALRQPGEEFEVPAGTKGSWFHPVGPKAAKGGKKHDDANADDKPAADLV